MSFLKKLADRTKAVTEQRVKDLTDAFDGLKASEEQRSERYDICKKCDHFVSVTTTCTKCGCFMAAKTYLAGVECPVGKWGKVIEIKKID